MRIERWAIDPELAREAEENYRTAFTKRLADYSGIEIMRQLTFDGVVPRITPEEVGALLSWISTNILPRSLRGVGIEVGSGPLVFSSILARSPVISLMYGVEVCAPLVEELAPIVARDLLGTDSDKLVGVVGSFDAMALPDSSVDFVFDFYSLHHALDVKKTFQEIGRVLKPGGVLLMLDKARPDEYTDGDLDTLLDQEYSESYKAQFGIPIHEKLTRRMNGEREYRLSDWRKAMHAGDMEMIRFYNLQQTSGGSLLVRLYKRCMSWLPLAIQVAITRRVAHTAKRHAFALDTKQRIFSSYANPFRKEMSVLVGEKRNR